MKKIDEVTAQEVPHANSDEQSGMERFFQARLPQFRSTFMGSAQVAGLPPEQKEQKWQEFLPRLQQYFMTDPTIRHSYHAVKHGTVWRRPGLGEFESMAEEITSTLLGD